jgi:hypothetical protein
VGRKNIQLMGFCLMSVLYLVCAYGHDYFMDVTVEPSELWLRRNLYLLVYVSCYALVIPFLFFDVSVSLTQLSLPACIL